MAKRDLTLSVGGNTRQLEQQIQALSKNPFVLNFKAQGGKSPLGKISGDLGQFEKSLEASNARVLAFGASAGALFAVQAALKGIIVAGIDVEKALADVNVILNASSSRLETFSGELFNIAKNTSQSFFEVAKAASELARQGLSIEETLKRTQDALILTRLSGLSVVDSVEAITAALNSFGGAVSDSTELVNKLAAVDSAFAVSAADLADSIKRVGSSASDAGVSIDQLIALVTSAQQITARGGAVIGNSFKTIFSRLQRPKTLEALNELGIATTDLGGKTLPAIQILKQLAQTFDSLSSAQKSQVTELVGGVFQINILKAALKDLGREYSIYENALNTSTGATDEAIRRNEELNKTVASLANKTIQNLTKVGAGIGALTFEPAIKNILNATNDVLESVDLTKAEDTGSKIAAGIFSGLGKFLSGPGILVAALTLGKIFQRMTSQVADAFKTISGIGQLSNQQLAIQEKTFQLLAGNPQILAQIQKGELTVNQAANAVLTNIRHQNEALNQQVVIVNQIAAALARAGVAVASVGPLAGRLATPRASSGFIPRAASGFIPNLAPKDSAAAAAELSSASYAKNSTRAVLTTMPGIGKIMTNSEETKTLVAGQRQYFINPPPGSKEGKVHRAKSITQTGIDPYINNDQMASSGFVPNFQKADAPTARIPYYDFDETLGTYPPSVSGRPPSDKAYADKSLFSTRSLRHATPTDIAKKLKAKGTPFHVNTARGQFFTDDPDPKTEIKKTLKSPKFGLNNVQDVIALGSQPVTPEDFAIAKKLGMEIRVPKRGKSEGQEVLSTEQRKVIEIYKKSGGGTLIDDNAKLRNVPKDVLEKAGVKLAIVPPASGESRGANLTRKSEGFVPNFAPNSLTGYDYEKDTFNSGRTKFDKLATFLTQKGSKNENYPKSFQTGIGEKLYGKDISKTGIQDFYKYLSPKSFSGIFQDVNAGGFRGAAPARLAGFADKLKSKHKEIKSSGLYLDELPILNSQGFIPNLVNEASGVISGPLEKFKPAKPKETRAFKYPSLPDDILRGLDKLDERQRLGQLGEGASLTALANIIGADPKTVIKPFKRDLLYSAIREEYNGPVAAHEKGPDIKERLKKLAVAGTQEGLKRGIDFENDFAENFYLDPRQSRNPIDFTQKESRSLIGRKHKVAPEDLGLAGLTPHMEAHAGKGHGDSHMINKALRNEQKTDLSSLLKNQKTNPKGESSPLNLNTKIIKEPYSEVIGQGPEKLNTVGVVSVENILKHGGKVVADKKDHNKEVQFTYSKDLIDSSKLKAKATTVASSGFIPNFADERADKDAVSRERAAGIPSGAIRVDTSPKLVTPQNPEDKGIYNTLQESSLNEGIKFSRQAGSAAQGIVPNLARHELPAKGAARGFVPNFILDMPELAVGYAASVADGNNLGARERVFSAGITELNPLARKNTEEILGVKDKKAKQKLAKEYLVLRANVDPIKISQKDINDKAYKIQQGTDDERKKDKRGFDILRGVAFERLLARDKISNKNFIDVPNVSEILNREEAKALSVDKNIEELKISEKTIADKNIIGKVINQYKNKSHIEKMMAASSGFIPNFAQYTNKYTGELVTGAKIAADKSLTDKQKEEIYGYKKTKVNPDAKEKISFEDIKAKYANSLELINIPVKERVTSKDLTTRAGQTTNLASDYGASYEKQVFSELPAHGFSKVLDLNKIINSNAEADFLAGKSDSSYLVDAKVGYNDTKVSSIQGKLSNMQRLGKSPVVGNLIQQNKLPSGPLKYAFAFGNLESIRAKKMKSAGLLASEGFIPNFTKAPLDDAMSRERSAAGSAVPLFSKMLNSPVVVNNEQIAKYGSNADRIIQGDHIENGQVATRSNLMKSGSGKEKYSSEGFIPNFGKNTPGKIGEGARMEAYERIGPDGKPYVVKAPKAVGVGPDGHRKDAIAQAIDQETLSQRYKKALAPFPWFNALEQKNVGGGILKQPLAKGKRLSEVLNNAYPSDRGAGREVAEKSKSGALGSFQQFFGKLGLPYDRMGMAGNIIVPEQHQAKVVEIFQKQARYLYAKMFGNQGGGFPNGAFNIIDYAKGFVPNFAGRKTPLNRDFLAQVPQDLPELLKDSPEAAKTINRLYEEHKGLKYVANGGESFVFRTEGKDVLKVPYVFPREGPKSRKGEIGEEEHENVLNRLFAGKNVDKEQGNIKEKMRRFGGFDWEGAKKDLAGTNLVLPKASVSADGSHYSQPFAGSILSDVITPKSVGPGNLDPYTINRKIVGSIEATFNKRQKSKTDRPINRMSLDTGVENFTFIDPKKNFDAKNILKADRKTPKKIFDNNNFGLIDVGIRGSSAPGSRPTRSEGFVPNFAHHPRHGLGPNLQPDELKDLAIFKDRPGILETAEYLGSGTEGTVYEYTLPSGKKKTIKVSKSATRTPEDIINKNKKRRGFYRDETTFGASGDPDTSFGVVYGDVKQRKNSQGISTREAILRELEDPKSTTQKNLIFKAQFRAFKKIKEDKGEGKQGNTGVMADEERAGTEDFKKAQQSGTKSYFERVKALKAAPKSEFQAEYDPTDKSYIAGPKGSVSKKGIRNLNIATAIDPNGTAVTFKDKVVHDKDSRRATLNEREFVTEILKKYGLTPDLHKGLLEATVNKSGKIEAFDTDYSRGFIPNLAGYSSPISPGESRQILRDFLKIQREVVHPNRKSDTVNLHRGVQGLSSRWANVDLENADKIREEVFRAPQPRAPATTQEYLDMFRSKSFGQLTEGNRSEPGGSLSSKTLPFLSTSTSKSVAKKFAGEGGVVRSSKIKTNRILAEEENYEPLYKKYGKEKVKEVLFRASKVGGGRGLGMDANRIRPDSEYHDEKEITLFSGGFIPNLAGYSSASMGVKRGFEDHNNQINQAADAKKNLHYLPVGSSDVHASLREAFQKNDVPIKPDKGGFTLTDVKRSYPKLPQVVADAKKIMPTSQEERRSIAGEKNTSDKAFAPIWQRFVESYLSPQKIREITKLATRAPTAGLAGGFVPNFAPRSGVIENKNGGYLSFIKNKEEKSAAVSFIDTKKQGGSGELYKEFAEKMKKSGVKTVSGQFFGQEGNVPRGNDPVSLIKAAYPQIIRARSAKSSKFVVQEGIDPKTNKPKVSTFVLKGGENFDKDLKAQAPKILKSITPSKEEKAGGFSRQVDMISTLANGFIPSFNNDALASAMNRENKAGIPRSEIRVGSDSSLTSRENPQGLGVFNTGEGSLAGGINLAKEAGINPKTKGMSRGFVPNFAAPVPVKRTTVPLNKPDSAPLEAVHEKMGHIASGLLLLSQMFPNTSVGNAAKDVATRVGGFRQVLKAAAQIETAKKGLNIGEGVKGLLNLEEGMVSMAGVAPAANSTDVPKKPKTISLKRLPDFLSEGFVPNFAEGNVGKMFMGGMTSGTHEMPDGKMMENSAMKHGVMGAVEAPDPTYSRGFIPNFNASSLASSEIQGALAGGYMPGKVVKSPVGGVMNTAEDVVYAAGFSQPFINPPERSKAGREHKKTSVSSVGLNPYELNSAKGFIPNLAPLPDTGLNQNIDISKSRVQELIKRIKAGKAPLSHLERYVYDSLTNKLGSQNQEKAGATMAMSQSISPKDKEAYGASTASATKGKSGGLWAQWDVIKNEGVKPNQPEIANFKSYFSTNAESLQKINENAPKLQELLKPIAEKWKTNLSFKTPGGATVAAAHNDSLVVHYTDPRAKDEIESTIRSFAASKGIKFGARSYDRGYDVNNEKVGYPEQRNTEGELKQVSSYGEVLAKRAARELMAGKTIEQVLPIFKSGFAGGFIPNFAKAPTTRGPRMQSAAQGIAPNLARHELPAKGAAQGIVPNLVNEASRVISSSPESIASSGFTPNFAKAPTTRGPRMQSAAQGIVPNLANKASSVIPNFSEHALDEAIGREKAAGYSSSEVKVGYDSRIGTGVYNKGQKSLRGAIKEHLDSGQSIRELRTQGAAQGFVPNLTIPAPGAPVPPEPPPKESSSIKFIGLSIAISTATGIIEQFSKDFSPAVKGSISAFGALTSGLFGVVPVLADLQENAKTAGGKFTAGLLKNAALVFFVGQFINDLGKSLTSVSEKLVKGAEDVRDKYNQLSGNVSQYASVFQELYTARADFRSTPETLQKLDKRLNALIASIPPQFSAELIGISDPGALQSKVAEIIEKEGKKAISVETSAKIGQSLDNASNLLNLFGGRLGILGDSMNAAGKNLRTVFKDAVGQINLGRTVDDIAKSIDFKGLQDKLKAGGASVNTLSDKQDEFADQLVKNFGAHESLAALVKEMASSDFLKLRNELINLANTARRGSENLAKLSKFKSEKAAELGIPQLERTISILTANLESEAESAKKLGGGISAFLDPKTMKEPIERFIAGLSVIASRAGEKGPGADIARGRGQVETGDFLQQIGVPTELDPTTGKAGGVFGSIIKEALPGVATNIRSSLQQAAAEIARTQQKVVQKTGKADPALAAQLAKIQEILKSALPEQAARKQLVERFGIKEQAPQAVNLAAAVGAGGGGKTIQQILAEQGVDNLGQQREFISTIKEGLDRDIKQKQEQAKKTKDPEEKKKLDEEVKKLETLKQGVSLSTTVGALRQTEEGKTLLQKNIEVKPEESPAQKALRLAQDRLTAATDALRVAVQAKQEEDKNDRGKKKEILAEKMDAAKREAEIADAQIVEAESEDDRTAVLQGIAVAVAGILALMLVDKLGGAAGMLNSVKGLFGKKPPIPTPGVPAVPGAPAVRPPVGPGGRPVVPQTRAQINASNDTLRRRRGGRLTPRSASAGRLTPRAAGFAPRGGMGIGKLGGSAALGALGAAVGVITLGLEAMALFDDFDGVTNSFIEANAEAGLFSRALMGATQPLTAVASLVKELSATMDAQAEAIKATQVAREKEIEFNNKQNKKADEKSAKTDEAVKKGEITKEEGAGIKKASDDEKKARDIDTLAIRAENTQQAALTMGQRDFRAETTLGEGSRQMQDLLGEDLTKKIQKDLGRENEKGVTFDESFRKRAIAELKIKRIEKEKEAQNKKPTPAKPENRADAMGVDDKKDANKGIAANIFGAPQPAINMSREAALKSSRDADMQARAVEIQGIRAQQKKLEIDRAAAAKKAISGGDASDFSQVGKLEAQKRALESEANRLLQEQKRVSEGGAPFGGGGLLEKQANSLTSIEGRLSAGILTQDYTMQEIAEDQLTAIEELSESLISLPEAFASFEENLPTRIAEVLAEMLPAAAEAKDVGAAPRAVSIQLNVSVDGELDVFSSEVSSSIFAAVKNAVMEMDPDIANKHIGAAAMGDEA